MSKRRASFLTLLVVAALGTISCSETSTPTEPTAAQANVTINVKALGVCSLSSVHLTVDSRPFDVPVSVLSVTVPVSAGHHTYSFYYVTTGPPLQAFTGMNGTFDVQAGMSVEITMVSGDIVCGVAH